MVAVDAGTASATREEVEQINHYFNQFAIIMDKLFHYVNLPHEQVDAEEGDNFIADLDECVKTFIWLWNYFCLSLLKQKFHTMKDHLVDFFWQLHAISPYNEDFTESDHVKGNAETHIFGALQDAQSWKEVVSKQAVIMEHPEV